MSSLIRRIERQSAPSCKFHVALDGSIYANPPRGKFFGGRGSKLGVRNPRAADLLARLKRDKAHGRKAK